MNHNSYMLFLQKEQHLTSTTQNFYTDVSDFHHMTTTFIKGNATNCVTLETFHGKKYIHDLDNIISLDIQRMFR